jgi:CheY-like chemotaxis protein
MKRNDVEKKGEKSEPENRSSNNSYESSNPSKIVLADDDADDRHLFEEALSETNPDADLTTVKNGKELMEHLDNEQAPNPDMIFLDINMPVKNGTECLDEIRSKKELSQVPVVMLSTSDAPKDVKDSYDKGANLFVKKPSYFSHLIVILKKIFSLQWKEFFPKPKKEKFILNPNEKSL